MDRLDNLDAGTSREANSLREAITYQQRINKTFIEDLKGINNQLDLLNKTIASESLRIERALIHDNRISGAIKSLAETVVSLKELVASQEKESKARHKEGVDLHRDLVGIVDKIQIRTFSVVDDWNQHKHSSAMLFYKLVAAFVISLLSLLTIIATWALPKVAEWISPF